MFLGRFWSAGDISQEYKGEADYRAEPAATGASEESPKTKLSSGFGAPATKEKDDPGTLSRVAVQNGLIR